MAVLFPKSEQLQVGKLASMARDLAEIDEALCGEFQASEEIDNQVHAYVTKCREDAVTYMMTEDKLDCMFVEEFAKTLDALSADPVLDSKFVKPYLSQWNTEDAIIVQYFNILQALEY